VCHEMAHLHFAGDHRSLGARVQRVNVFAREGEYWTVVFDGRVSRLRDAKGLHYLDHLLRHPGEEFHALALAGAADLPGGDAGEVLDAKAVAAYRERVHELRDEIDDAEASGDALRLQRAQDELDAVAEQLAAGLGLGGRHRRAGSTGERARLAVTKAIKASLRKIEQADPALGRHLERTVRTGTFCAYLPDPAADLVWTSEQAAAVRQAAPSPAVEREAAPHVGRPLERRLVGELVAAAAAGRGGILLVSGEAGIGKTRLAEDALEEARRRGMGTFVGRCLEGETSLPWLPLVEVLDQLVRQLDDQALRELLAGAGGEVARVLPALRRRLPGLPAPLELPAEHARHVLFTNLRDLVLRLGASRPAVVVLEDVHWADPATLSMLEHLAGGLEDARILVLATYRGDEAALGTPLARTVEWLSRHRSCSSIALRPLDTSETADLIAAVSGRVPPPTLAARLWADGDGNPFFVQALLAHLTTEHRLYDEDGLFRADLGSQPLGVPESLRLLLGHRLRRLSEPCRRTLNVAAVLGRDVDVDLLAAATEGVAEDVLDAVEEALTAGVLVGDGGERIGFSHALVRAAALAELPAARRRLLHLNVASALRRLHGDDPLHAAEIADHLEQAGRAAETPTKVHYLELAARRSLESAAYEDALGRVERALALGPAGLDAPTRARLLAARGHAQRGLGRPDDANASWLEAFDVLEADPGRDVTLTAELSRALGRYLDATGGLTSAIAIVERGLGLVGTDHPVERSWLRSAHGYALILSADIAGATAAIDEAAALASTAGDARVEADVLASTTSLQFATGRLAACVETAERATAALLACGQPWDAIQAEVTTLWPRLWLGRMEDVRQYTERTLATAERLGHVPAVFLARRTLALLELLAGGDLDHFAAQAAEGVAFCRTHRLRWLADAHVFAGLGQIWRGDRDAARTHLEAAATTPVPPVYAGRYSATLLTFYAWAGEEAAFDALLARLHSTFAALGLERSIGTVAVTLAEVEGQAVLGRFDRAAALYPDVAALLHEGIVLRPPDLRIVASLAGLAAGLAGDAATSREHFAEARRLVEALPHRRQASDVVALEALAAAGP
jgi:tetratricopeptide (TPR) repeat protein